MPLFSVRDLCVEFKAESFALQALFGVSFSIEPGQVLGIVGESGSGKSVTAMSLLRLLAEPPAHISKGCALFSAKAGGHSIDLLKCTERELAGIRGNQIGFVFQDPMTSLNPYLTIGEQLREGLMHHRGMSRKEAEERAMAMLTAVRMREPSAIMKGYAHELSGGMRQRVLIAAALLCDPVLLIADEPTTALDASVQAEVLNVLNERVFSSGAAMLIITHDFGVIAKTSDRVAVMYAGRIVEEAPAAEILARPRHPYTIALSRSRPDALGEGDKDLEVIAGAPPRLGKIPPGCPFHPRCPHAFERCQAEEPELRIVDQFDAIDSGEKKTHLHLVRCHIDSPEGAGISH